MRVEETVFLNLFFVKTCVISWLKLALPLVLLVRECSYYRDWLGELCMLIPNVTKVEKMWIPGTILKQDDSRGEG